MAAGFQVGKWYRVRKPLEPRAQSPSNLQWVPGMDASHDQVLQCSAASFNNLHGFLSRARYHCYHADWVDGPFDSAEEAELLGHFAGTIWNPANNCHIVKYVNKRTGIVTERMISAEGVYRDGLIESKSYSPKPKEENVAPELNLPGEYMSQVRPKQFFKHSKNIADRDIFIHGDHVSGWQEEQTYQAASIDTNWLLAQMDAKIAASHEALLAKMQRAGDFRVFTQDDRLYAIKPDGIWEYCGDKKVWEKLYTANTLTTTDRLKAEFREIDKKADQDIDNLISGYQAKWAARKEERAKIRAQFETGSAVFKKIPPPPQKWYAKLWPSKLTVVKGLVAVAMTAAGGASWVYWPFISTLF